MRWTRPLVVTLLLVASSMVGMPAAAAQGVETDPGPVDPEPTWQSPFLCTTEFQGLGQPIVDNQKRRGTPVYPEGPDGTPDRTQAPVGWSEACQAEPVVEYRYRTTAGELEEVPAGATALPADIAWLDDDDLVGAGAMGLGDAKRIPYLVRYERGTLPENRFLYSIATLAPEEALASGDAETGGRPRVHWNGRLVFSFGGGVGIGHTQGELSTNGGTLDEALRLGHAVLYSSGTRTSTHYNLLLGGRTAVEAKARFVERLGEPRYTVGIGGSGGAIQQYVYAQNHPDLLDGLIPQYSYPDMTTQTIHIGDCELLEHYMDVVDAGNPRWDDWDQRKLVEGLNSIEGFTSEWQERTGATGSSECIEGWRGATPLALNPTFGFSPGMDDVVPLYLGDVLAGRYPEEFPDLGRLLRIHEDPSQWVEWTHWDDVREVYGIDPASGFARIPWDNVGVQYGLRAVATGQLTPEEFLDLNARIGSWKEPEELVPESCALASALGGEELGLLASVIGMCEGDDPDWWSARQMEFSSDAAQPAPRRTADVEAIEAAFEQGLVFSGHLPREVPIIDARHYLEEQLDMHNAHQSFAVRERIRRAHGDVDNHAIWFLDARPEEDEQATSRLFERGFRVMDRWIRKIERHPTGDVGESRPRQAADSCWRTDGRRIARGEDVWSGAAELIESGLGAWTVEAPDQVDGVPVGECAAAFPLYSTSRIVAGGPVTGDVYKCRTQPVAEAIAGGLYGQWTPTPEQQAQLEAIFPDGVCDYSVPGVGHPAASNAFAADRALDRALTRFVERTGVPGIAAVVQRGDEEPALHTAGVADVATGAVIGADDHLRLASVAKAFSGAMALSAVAEGELALTDTLVEVVPGMPSAWGGVTLAQLLHHTSGIPDFSTSEAFGKAISASLLSAPSPSVLLSYVADQPLLFTPGSEYRYSNSDNIAVGLMVEAATGRSYEQELEERVFRPLGLSRTSLPSGAALPSPFVHGYDVADGEDVSELFAAGWTWASGGIVATPMDANRFIRAYASGATTDERTRAEQFDFVEGHSEPPGPGRNAAGLAIFRYETRCGTVYGHTGNTSGYTQFVAATGDGSRSATVSINAQITPARDEARFRQLRRIFGLAVCAALADPRR